MRNISSKIIILSVYLLLLVPVTVFAQGAILNPANSIGLPGTFLSANTFGGLVVAIVKMLLSLAGIIAVGMIVYGGFRYITSRGDEKVTTAAKNTITNSVIGLIIIILAFVIVTIATNAAFGRYL